MLAAALLCSNTSIRAKRVMPLAPDKDAAVDAAGPLNALEADRYVEELRPFEFDQFGDSRWMNQHEYYARTTRLVC